LKEVHTFQFFFFFFFQFVIYYNLQYFLFLKKPGTTSLHTYLTWLIKKKSNKESRVGVNKLLNNFSYKIICFKPITGATTIAELNSAPSLHTFPTHLYTTKI
jgi:hypothetical protein